MCCAKSCTEEEQTTEHIGGHYVELHTLSKLIISQSKKVFCKKSLQLVRIPGSALTFEKNGDLLKTPVDAWFQKLSLTSLPA